MTWTTGEVTPRVTARLGIIYIMYDAQYVHVRILDVFINKYIIIYHNLWIWLNESQTVRRLMLLQFQVHGWLNDVSDLIEAVGCPSPQENHLGDETSMIELA